jgi:hypothetical protein
LSGVTSGSLFNSSEDKSKPSTSLANNNPLEEAILEPPTLTSQLSQIQKKTEEKTSENKILSNLMGTTTDKKKEKDK